MGFAVRVGGRMVSVRQVAEWMGHANPTTTELVYTHLYAKADHDDEMAALGALAAIPMYNGDNVIPLHGSGRLPERVRTSAGNPGFLGFKPLPNFVGPSLAFCVLLVQVVLVCVDVRGDDGSSGLAAKVLPAALGCSYQSSLTSGGVSASLERERAYVSFEKVQLTLSHVAAESSVGLAGTVTASPLKWKPNANSASRVAPPFSNSAWTASMTIAALPS